MEPPGTKRFATVDKNAKSKLNIFFRLFCGCAMLATTSYPLFTEVWEHWAWIVVRGCEATFELPFIDSMGSNLGRCL